MAMMVASQCQSFSCASVTSLHPAGYALLQLTSKYKQMHAESNIHKIQSREQTMTTTTTIIVAIIITGSCARRYMTSSGY